MDLVWRINNNQKYFIFVISFLGKIQLYNYINIKNMFLRIIVSNIKIYTFVYLGLIANRKKETKVSIFVCLKKFTVGTSSVHRNKERNPADFIVNYRQTLLIWWSLGPYKLRDIIKTNFKW